MKDYYAIYSLYGAVARKTRILLSNGYLLKPNKEFSSFDEALIVLSAIATHGITSFTSKGQRHTLPITPDEQYCIWHLGAGVANKRMMAVTNSNNQVVVL